MSAAEDELEALMTAIRDADRCDRHMDELDPCDGLDGCRDCLDAAARAVRSVGPLAEELAAANPMLKPMISRMQLAKLLDVAPATLRNWHRRGFGPVPRQVGPTRGLRYDLEEVMSFLEVRRLAPAEAAK